MIFQELKPPVLALAAATLAARRPVVGWIQSFRRWLNPVIRHPSPVIPSPVTPSLSTVQTPLDSRKKTKTGDYNQNFARIHDCSHSDG